MKKAAIILLFAIISFTANAQAPFVQWQRSLGGSGDDATFAIEPTSDGGYIAVCKSASDDGDVTGNHGDYDYWLVKMTAWGSIVWQRSIGGTANDVPTTIQQTTDGGYIVAGLSVSTDGDVTGNHGNSDLWVLKVNDTGGIQWEQSYGDSSREVANAIRQTADGGYIVAGWTTSDGGEVVGNHGGYDYWVLKLTSTGSITWAKTYGGSNDDLATSIKQTKDGGYIVAGNTSSNDGDVAGSGYHGGDDVWVVKLNDTGGISWQKCYGGSGDEDVGDEAYPGDIEQTFDSGYVFAAISSSNDGDVTGNHGGIYDFWIVKLTPTGNIVWEKCYGGSGDDQAYSVKQTSDSGYIAAGPSNSLDGDVTGLHGIWDDWIIRLSPSGSLIWEQCYGGTGDDNAYWVRQVSDSAYVVAGYSASNDGDVSGNHGGYDGWVLKLAYCSLPVVGAISGSSVVCAGSQITLNESTPVGTWSAGNTSYATISPGGMLSGISGGTETILYSVTNGCGTGGATAVITISQPVPVITKAGDTLSTAIGYSAYQWTFDGTNIPGATSATHIATVSGTYSVTVTNSYGCTGTSAADTFIRTGIGNLNNTAISIIPNPTNGAVYIKGTGRVNIGVYNAIGQLLKEAANTDNISIAELPAALYLIRVYDERGILVRQEKITRE